MTHQTIEISDVFTRDQTIKGYLT